jgi:hypothetical protein
MATLFLYTPFVFHANHTSKDAAPNVNGTIWNQSNHVNAVTLLNGQYPVSQLLNELIRRRFVQYSQNFSIKTIQRMSSGVNFIMEVLTTEPYLCNPESNRSKCISMFIKLCLKSVCNFMCIDSLVPSFQRNRMITLWSYSIRNVPLTDFKVQNEKIITPSITCSKPTWSI